MIKEIKGYYTPKQLAPIYKRQDNGVGVTRQHIYQLIKAEMANSGSTDLEVTIIAGKKFVKQIKK